MFPNQSLGDLRLSCQILNPCWVWFPFQQTRSHHFTEVARERWNETLSFYFVFLFKKGKTQRVSLVRRTSAVCHKLVTIFACVLMHFDDDFRFLGITENPLYHDHYTSPPSFKKKHRKWPTFWENSRRLNSEPNSDLLLKKSNSKHPDWKHHNLAWFMHSPGQEGSAEHHWYPTTEHQWHRWSEMSAQHPPQPQSVHTAAIWKKIQKYLISAAVPPAYEVASSHRLWEV